MRRIIFTLGLSALLIATPAWSQLRPELGGTGTTANTGTNDTFLVGNAGGTAFIEETPSGTCDATSFLTFDATQADGSRAVCTDSAAFNGDITDVFGCASGACLDITMGATDSLDASAIDANAAGEGIILPQAATCATASVPAGSICYGTTADELCVSDGTAFDCVPLTTGASEWTDTGTVLHPADLSGAEDVVVGGTTAANSDIVLFGEATNPGGMIVNEQSNAVGEFRVESGASTDAIEVDYATDQINFHESAPVADDSITFGDDFNNVLAANQDGSYMTINGTVSEFVGASTHAAVIGVDIEALNITNDATAVTTDAATLRVQGSPAGVTPTGDALSVWVDDGDIRIDGGAVANIIRTDASLNAVGLGATPDDVDNPLRVAFPTVVVTANQIGQAVNIEPNLTEAASGTHATMVGVDIDALTLTAGVGATTDAATVRIAGAPTGATNNYSLWVDAGNVQFDEDLTVLGSDLFWSTNTSGHLLINDGASFKNVAVTGDVTITGAGVTAQDFLVINEDLVFDFDGVDTVSAALANTVSGAAPNHNIDVFFSGYALEQVAAAPANDEFTFATNQVTLGLAPAAADNGHVTATYIY